jgi:two-component sensor histidine kinase
MNAGWDPAFEMQLALVIEELMVNALVHGGQEAGQGKESPGRQSGRSRR